MNPNDHIEADLERLSETVSLRADEKALHRENVMAFMQKNPKPVRSPYFSFFGPGVRYAAALLLVVVVSGGGVVSASGGAKPGDTLYYVKLKVAEPARSALILDPEEKTQYALERADRRLKEFAIVAASENPDPETTALITQSLSENIAQITEDVGDLTAAGDADQALNANADLQSLLSAHSLVLDTIEEQHPENSVALDTIAASVDAGIASSENAQQGIEDALAPSLTDGSAISDQAADTETTLTELRDQLVAESASVNDTDKTTIEESLMAVDEIIGEARAARTSGNDKDAYLLYTEADQKLNALKTLVEADRDLGIGVIDSEAEAAE